MELRDIFIAILSLFDVISGAVLALSFGFLMIPSALGYLVGAVGGLVTGSVTPVSFMYENMILSWNQSKDFRERVSMILYAAIFTALLGVFGLPKWIVDSIGNDVFFAMLAGVGLYLAKTGFKISAQKPLIGAPSFIAAILIQLFTNDLFITVAGSVALGIVINLIYRRVKKITADDNVPIKKYKNFFDRIKSELKPNKLIINTKVLIGALALSTLTIGGNIAYTAANAQLAGEGATYNQSTIISGLADLASTTFGGANMELIVTPTATSPNPVFSGILFMVLAAVLLFSGIVEKIYKWFPISAMGGYLFVIGAVLILPYNAIDAFKIGDPSVVALTMAVTAFANPFYGILAGVGAKLILLI